ncbi:MAG: hypothetical protein KF774_12605 [Planctomyces sp.]|nr:hypothetical protein [Planctomyces sp.]
MDAGRASYLCGMVLGCALGFAAAHVAFLTRDRESADPRRVVSLDDDVVQEQDLAAGSFVISSPHIISTLGGSAPIVDRSVVALADLPPEPDTSSVPAAAPRPLSAPENALPLSARSLKDDGTLREMIRQELHTFTTSDHDVWYEALRDLPPADANSILKLWKATKCEMPLSSIAVPTTGAPTAAIDPREPPATSHALPGPTPPVRMADQELPGAHPSTTKVATSGSSTILQLIARNLANSDTPGYKRLDPLLCESPQPGTSDDGAAAGWSPRLVGIRLDMRPGELVESGRPLDFAIDGQAFFVVQCEGRQLFTRCGRMTLDAGRRLSLDLGDGRSAVLEPEIVVPEHSQRINIDAFGEARAELPSQTDPEGLGSIALVRFLDATALEPVGSGLFQATAASGSAVPLPHEQRVPIRQGWYERSNVDPAYEQELLWRWSMFSEGRPPLPGTLAADDPADADSAVR